MAAVSTDCQNQSQLCDARMNQGRARGVMIEVVRPLLVMLRTASFFVGWYEERLHLPRLVGMAEESGSRRLGTIEIPLL